MIAIDTNVLVRFLTQDDPEQAAAASAFMRGLTPAAPGFISREVMVELVWVLERAYRFSRAEVSAALEGLRVRFLRPDDCRSRASRRGREAGDI
jgi:predicted nucleic-acid-binding protein